MDWNTGNDVESEVTPYRAYEGGLPYAFVSYAHGDSGDVFPIVRDLQEQGFRLWYDEGIGVGTRWDDSILRHLENASCVILFMTDRYLSRPYCRKELEYAQAHGKGVIPVSYSPVFDASAPSLNLEMLADIQQLDARGKVREELVDKLSRSPELNRCKDEFVVECGRSFGFRQACKEAEKEWVDLTGDLNSDVAPLDGGWYEESDDGDSFVAADRCFANVLTDFIGGGESITVPQDVREIGELAFAACSASEIALPEGLVHIGSRAFFGCRDLKAMYVPDGVLHIEKEAFRKCASLVSLSLPPVDVPTKCCLACESLEEVEIRGGDDGGASRTFVIGDRAFLLCDRLRSVSLSEGLTRIGGEAFSNCTRLEDLRLPDSLECIDSAAFQFCSSLSTVKMPAHIKYISPRAFQACDGLREICIAAEIADEQNSCSIDQEAFSECTSLERVELRGVGYLADAVFENCTSLESFSADEALWYINDETFAGCSSLKDVHLPEGIDSIGFMAFEGCESLEEITIPNSVREIGKRAFFGCSSLQSIALPASVEHIGAGAFFECPRLEKAFVPLGLAGDAAAAFGPGTEVIYYS